MPGLPLSCVPAVPLSFPAHTGPLSSCSSSCHYPFFLPAAPTHPPKLILRPRLFKDTACIHGTDGLIQHFLILHKGKAHISLTGRAKGAAGSYHDPGLFHQRHHKFR